MHRAIRAARTFATYTTLAGAVGVGSFLAYHRKAEFVDFPLGADQLFRSAAYIKFNPLRNDGVHDYCVRRVPLSEIKPEYLQDAEAGKGTLVDRFAGGVWGEYGFAIQRNLEAKKRSPENDSDLWEPAELKTASYQVGTRVTNHFEVLERTPTSIAFRAGDTPLNPGIRASDGIVELSAEVKPEEGYAEFGFKCVFYRGDGPGEAFPAPVAFLHRMYTKLLVEAALRNVCK
uniref:Uncharacterized protein n=1 Tax=Mycena chlorophos TaxID=658473 RepID=A0ABQ0M6H4_MYCCL|nr:predicted protein [Mycena chlorophos]